MRRIAKLFSLSALCAVAFVSMLALSGMAQDPAPGPVPAPAPVAKPVTVGDLVTSLTSAKGERSQAQDARDAAAKALADAEAVLADKAAAVTKADDALKSAVTKLGPVLIDGTVYEPSSDSYRTFKPLGADTPVPIDPGN